MSILVTSTGKYILAGAKGFISVNNASSGGTVTPPTDPLVDDTVPGGTSGTTSLTLTDFYSSHQYARPVIQRSALSMTDAGGPWGNVPVLFTFAGAQPAYPQARVVKASDGTAVTGWKTLTNLSVVGNTMLGTLPKVPQGGYYLLQVRDGQKTTVTSNGSKQWGVGVQILAIGQSNQVGMLDGGVYNDAVGASNEYDLWFGGQVSASLFGASGWMHPTNTGTPNGGSSSINYLGGGLFSTMRVVAQGLETKYGKKIPVGLVPWAFNSHPISEFIATANPISPSSPKIDLLFKGSGTAITGSIGSAGYNQVGFNSPKNYAFGDFEVVTMYQGEANSDGTMTRAQYFGALKQVYQGLLTQVSPYGRTAAYLAFLPGMLGVNLDSGYMYVERTRGAVLDLEAYAAANGWPKVRLAFHGIDLIPQASNGLHFEDLDAARQYRRWGLARQQAAMLWALGCSPYTGAGPRIASVSRTGLTATLTVTHEGGTALVKPGAGAITGFTANTAADFTGTNITVAAAIASNNTIAISFPGGTSFPVYLKYMGGRDGTLASQQPDSTNPVYDNASLPAGVNVLSSPALSGGGRAGFPLVPTPDSIVVN